MGCAGERPDHALAGPLAGLVSLVLEMGRAGRDGLDIGWDVIGLFRVCVGRSWTGNGTRACSWHKLSWTLAGCGMCCDGHGIVRPGYGLAWAWYRLGIDWVCSGRASACLTWAELGISWSGLGLAMDWTGKYLLGAWAVLGMVWAYTGLGKGSAGLGTPLSGKGIIIWDWEVLFMG